MTVQAAKEEAIRRGFRTAVLVSVGDVHIGEWELVEGLLRGARDHEGQAALLMTMLRLGRVKFDIVN